MFPQHRNSAATTTRQNCVKEKPFASISVLLILCCFCRLISYRRVRTARLARRARELYYRKLDENATTMICAIRKSHNMYIWIYTDIYIYIFKCQQSNTLQDFQRQLYYQSLVTILTWGQIVLWQTYYIIYRMVLKRRCSRYAGKVNSTQSFAQRAPRVMHDTHVRTSGNNR